MSTEATKGVDAMETIRSAAHRLTGAVPDSSGNALGESPPESRPENLFYRKLIHLKNNQRIMLRLLQAGDRENLINLFQKASPGDLWFFKHDLKNRQILNCWLDQLDYQRLLPLAAVNLEDNQLIAAATLWRGKHTAQHIGEIKLFISRPFRGLGLGGLILDELLRLARVERLYWLKAEVVADHKEMVRALRNKGFQIRATLEDFFVRKDGEAHDVLLLMLALREGSQEAF